MRRSDHMVMVDYVEGTTGATTHRKPPVVPKGWRAESVFWGGDVMLCVHCFQFVGLWVVLVSAVARGVCQTIFSVAMMPPEFCAVSVAGVTRTRSPFTTECCGTPCRVSRTIPSAHGCHHGARAFRLGGCVDPIKRRDGLAIQAWRAYH